MSTAGLTYVAPKSHEAARPPRDGEIPIIDVSGLRAGRPASRVVAAIGRAARHTGFFYIAGHDIDEELLTHTVAASKAFFAEPLAAKQTVAMAKSKHNRGYVPLEGEKLDPSRKGDVKETFSIGRDLPPDDPDVLAGRMFHGVNEWPEEPADFKRVMLAYYRAMQALCTDLHRAFALDLGMPGEFFHDKIDKPLGTLRLLHYPPHPGEFVVDQYGAAPHTDYGTCTVLWQDDNGGLEVQARSGEWIAAVPIPGTFVCNIGDCLMRWSNDTYVSTPHRVVNRSGRERWSMAFFLDPNAEAVIECLPTHCTPERPARYAPTTGMAYLKGCLDAVHDYRRA
ncbi:MAG TPA: 2-oxoglutarate and iron-dependent oxygenase domain-containing protein [Alphaproteobacteria bacterium]